MDPTEVTRANEGGHCHTREWIIKNVKEPQGFDMSRHSLDEVIKIGKDAIDWDNNWHAPGTKLLPNGNYHGIGFVSVYGYSAYSGNGPAALQITSDGKVRLLAKHTDGGYCGETAYCQGVADEIGMKYEDVTYRPFDDYAFELSGGGGSLGLCNNLRRWVGVARNAKWSILKAATSEYVRAGEFNTETPSRTEPAFPGKQPEDLDIWNGEIFEKANPENKVPVSSVARNWANGLLAWHWSPQVTGPIYFTCWQCYFMEVEVDPDTGKCDVKKVVVVNDVGKVINPDSCNGQQYGGTYMGIGRSNTEAIYYDPQTGIKLNDNLLGYEVPVLNDCGVIDCHLVETGQGYGAYGSVWIGESAGAIVSPLTAAAIYNAIGKWVDLPTTPNKVLKALGKA
jgi:CO/xanthine dehydrogenase Mo-binding subunit